MLKNVTHGDSIGKRLQTDFYGIHHMPGCSDGELYDCENLSSEFFPLMAPRKKRALYRTLDKANGLAGRDVLMWADGTEFFYGGEKKGEVSDGPKDFYFIGPYVIIWPDKLYYHVRLDEFGALEEIYVSGEGQITFSDGTYAEESAEKNSIITTGEPFNFEVGDAVTISGCSVEANNITPIIREISEDKMTLRFYENIFTIESGTSYTEPGSITIARTVPDMDFLCENENRLWGCKEDEIYCCNLGNPKVWQDYDGLATGAWAGSVGSAGDFTGCYSFLGYPIFFKEDAIHKVFGTKPTDFSYGDGPRMGLLEGCAGSFAVAGETLFYRSRAGIVRYNGGYPYLIDTELGNYSPVDCVAGTDGRRYYISGETKTGEDIFLCYDTQTKIWLREDSTRARAFAYAGGLYYLAGDEIWRVDASEEAEGLETELSSWAEFGDFYEGSPDRKNVSAIQVRAEVPEGAALRFKISFNGGAWQSIGEVMGPKQMHKLPIIPHRCDYWRLRIEGAGDWKIYAIAREFAAGSDMH